MEITPLLRWTALRLPTQTPLFSDALDASLLDVVAGSISTISCNTAHGNEIGEQVGICITAAPVPNKIIALTIDGRDVTMTTKNPHDVTRDWIDVVALSGFADARLNGEVQLVDIPDELHIIVRTPDPLPPIALAGTEQLNETLSRDVVGWHKVTANSATEYQFDTPASVNRSYNIANPTIVYNVRAWAAFSLDDAIERFLRTDGQFDREKPGIFITPSSLVSTSRDRRSKSSAYAEISSNMAFSQTLLDGFNILTFIPRADMGRVQLMDLSGGVLFSAMTRTYLGLKLPRSELSLGEGMACVLAQHRAVSIDNANYIHAYEFQAPAELVNEDVVSAEEQPDFASIGGAQHGHVHSAGSTAFRGLDFNINVDGSAPLSASIAPK